MDKQKSGRTGTAAVKTGRGVPRGTTPTGSAGATTHGEKRAKDHAQNKVVLNAESPIPFEIGNQAFVGFSGMEYLPFFNRDDKFGMTLLEARLLSTTQSSCINTKCLYTVGNGIVIKNLKEEQKPGQLWSDFATRANAKRQSLNRVFHKGWESLFTFGNTPVEFVRGEVGGKKFLYCYVRNFLDCRLGKPNEKTGEVEYALVTKQFRQKGVLTNKDKALTIPLYKPGRANDKDNWLKDGNVERTMVWIKNEVAGYDHYGLPSSIGSLIFQVLEYGGARFNLDNLENNMIIGSAIFLTGGLDQEEADRIGSTITRRHTGHGRRGRTIVFASEQGIDDAKVLNLETHKDSSYDKMNEICESKIILANDWDAVLAGLKHASSLGKGGGYLKEVYEQKLKTVIVPLQTRMIEDLMPAMVDIAKNHLGEDWSGYEFGFDPIQLDNKTSQASTTVEGLNAFLDIIAAVASGAYQQAAAEQLVMAWYGLSEKEAKARLGTIKVTNYVRTQSSGKGSSNNPSGNTGQDGNQQ